MKIFILSTDVTVMDDVKRHLNRSDFKIIGSTNDVELTVSKVKHLTPDLLITYADLLSVQHGNELIDQAKHYEVPIIYLTGNLDNSKYESIKNLECKKHIVEYPTSIFTFWSILDNISEKREDIVGPNYARNGYVFLKKNSEFHKIDLSTVDYMYSEGNYSSLVVGEKKFLIKFSLSKLLELGEFKSFLRIHRNYAVLKEAIKTVDFATKHLKTDIIELPFGRTYTKDIRRVMNLPFASVK